MLKNNKISDPVTYHDALASGWDQRYLRGSFGRRASFFSRSVLPLLPQSGLWLDAGCGTGTFARMLAQSGRVVVGVDASANMLVEAMKRLGQAADRLTFRRVETVESLPFPDEHFDGIVCLSVLEYLEFPFETLRELCRILRPGGVIALSMPHRNSVLRRLQATHEYFRSVRNGVSTHYLQHSRSAIDPSKILGQIRGSGLSLRCSIGFDPLLPRILHSVFHPSLVFMICAKAVHP